MKLASVLLKWRRQHRLTRETASGLLDINIGTLRAWEDERRKPKPLSEEALHNRLARAEARLQKKAPVMASKTLTGAERERRRQHAQRPNHKRWGTPIPEPVMA
jgi:hypothetical protein